MERSSNLPVLLFDWDGVIVDSNAWKWQGAWEEVFKEEPSLLILIKQILSNDPDKKLSRYELVQVLMKKADENGISCLLRQEDYVFRYGSAVREGVKRIGLFEDVHTILDELNQVGYKMYVISMSTQEDVDYLSEQLNVAQYFINLYGLPGGKYEHVRKIIEEEKSNGFIVIGDGEGDKNLAESIDGEFIAVTNEWNKWALDNNIKYKINHLLELPRILKKISSN